MIQALTLKRRIKEVITTLEVDVWIEDCDVHDVAARLCAKTHPGFYLAGYTCWGGQYYFVSRLIEP